MALLKDVSDRRIAAAAFALLTALGTGAVSYFLHSEAAGGYLISLIVSAVLVAIVGQAFFPDEEEKVVNVALVPALATSSAMVSAGLLQFGLSATMEDRMTVIGVMGAVTFVALLASYFIGRGKAAGNSGSSSAGGPPGDSGQPVAVSGD
jgi:biotin transporter BioY